MANREFEESSSRRVLRKRVASQPSSTGAGEIPSTATNSGTTEQSAFDELEAAAHKQRPDITLARTLRELKLRIPSAHDDLVRKGCALLVVKEELGHATRTAKTRKGAN